MLSYIMVAGKNVRLPGRRTSARRARAIGRRCPARRRDRGRRCLSNISGSAPPARPPSAGACCVEGWPFGRGMRSEICAMRTVMRSPRGAAGDRRRGCPRRTRSCGAPRHVIRREHVVAAMRRRETLVHNASRYGVRRRIDARPNVAERWCALFEWRSQAAISGSSGFMLKSPVRMAEAAPAVSPVGARPVVCVERTRAPKPRRECAGSPQLAPRGCRDGNTRDASSSAARAPATWR